MRDLITKDIFTIVRIINAADLKESVLNMMREGTNISIQYKDKFLKAKNEKEKSKIEEEILLKQKDMGVDFAFTLMSNLVTPKLEKMLYDFLSSLTGKNAKDIENQNMNDTLDDIMEICTNENIPDFFKKVSRLLQNIQQ